MDRALDILKQYYGYSSFREGQENIIREILNGNDVLTIMPTGGGKSICYQVPAMLLDGITIVISPLISLMKDQVDNINNLGIKSAYINSHVPDYNDKNYKKYLNIFAEDISQYSLCWKIDFKMTRIKSRILSHIYAFFSYHLFKYKYMYNYIRYECDALYY